MNEYIEPQTLSLDNLGEEFVVTKPPVYMMPDGEPVKEVANPNFPRASIKKSLPADLPACEPIRKCREHRHIATLSEVRKSHTEISSSQRPVAKTSIGGENRRMTPASIVKNSIAEPVAFRRGISPQEYTKNDWEDYKIYKGWNKFQ